MVEQKIKKINEKWDIIEHYIRRILLAFMIVLLVIQALYTNKTVASFLNKVEKLEGKSVIDSNNIINQGTIELQVETDDDINLISIYINGEKETVFEEKNITLSVRNNDIIEINGVKLSKPAKIKIINKSNNVDTPRIDNIILNKNIVFMDRIKLK